MKRIIAGLITLIILITTTYAEISHRTKSEVVAANYEFQAIYGSDINVLDVCDCDTQEELKQALEIDENTNLDKFWQQTIPQSGTPQPKEWMFMETIFCGYHCAFITHQIGNKIDCYVMF